MTQNVLGEVPKVVAVLGVILARRRWVFGRSSGHSPPV
jgi:type IV secretory pathway VirB2 component (pilin)